MARQEETNISTWRWGRNAFTVPENLGLYIPSYYDVPEIDDNHVLSGPLDMKKLKYNGEKIFSLLGGGFSYGNNEGFCFPSESIMKIFTHNSTTLNLPVKPDNSFLPRIQTFKYVTNETGTTVVVDRKFVYSPGSMFDLDGDRYKITVSSTGVYTVTLKATPGVAYDTTLPLHTTLVGGSKVFLLPEFPASNVVVTLSDQLIDYYRGIIYTTDAVTTLPITYNATPLITYQPIDKITDNALFFEPSVITSYFACLSMETEMYR